MIRTLCIVGVGLIGGSLARDLRRLGCVGEIVGASRNAAGEIWKESLFETLLPVLDNAPQPDHFVF